jgi:hypothetical protein
MNVSHNWSEWIDLAKIAGGAMVFWVSIWQYAKAQRWKRSEFIATVVKEMEADPRSHAIMTMLDYGPREICFPAENGKDVIPIHTSDNLICTALLPKAPAGGFSKDATLIREHVDRFLDAFVRFEVFVEAKLIAAEEIRPYIEYWVQLIAGKKGGRHSPEVFTLLHAYMQKFGFDQAIKLIGRYVEYRPVSKEAVDGAVRKTLEEYQSLECLRASAGSGSVG